MELDGFDREDAEHGGERRAVYRRGSGPAVIVISELPGITPDVARFARRVADAGMTAVLPHLFGVPGRAPSAADVGVIAAACVSREFTTLALRRASPVTTWLRALASAEHARCGGPGVGVVGMCFTGGFALAMMVDDTVLAPVLSQPSLPFPVTRAHRRDLGVSEADLARVKERCEEGICVLGLRFSDDRMAPGERFARLRDELGDAFVGVEIDSSPGNPHGNPRTAHSVLTRHLVDEPGHPTREALDRTLAFLCERLGVAGS